MTTTLKAVLFDLDDTLLDWSGFSSDWTMLETKHLGGVFDYIRAQGHALSDLESYVKEFRQRTLNAWTEARTHLRAPHLGRMLVESAVALGVPADALDWERCIECYAWAAVPGTVAFPEAANVLKLLHDHQIKVGIVTNAYQPMTLRDIEMRAHGLFDYFPDCRISAADVGYLKPHPTIFQTALNCLGTEPAETVFVGDDPEADIVGAKGVGLRAVLRISRRQPLDGITPDASIRSLDELPAILDGWYPGWRTAS